MLGSENEATMYVYMTLTVLIDYNGCPRSISGKGLRSGAPIPNSHVPFQRKNGPDRRGDAQLQV